MRIQPRQHLLEIWRSTAATSFRDGRWIWGGRSGPNSISDAEQLLCLTFPAYEIPLFRLDVPDETAEDVLEAMHNLGDSVEIPRLMTRIIREYMTHYTSDSGAPTFAGGSYYVPADAGDELTEEQRRLDVVDSFSMSVTLSLATIGFLRTLRRSVRRARLREEIDQLELDASNRLSAAMVGLLRSFTVNVFEPDSEPGRVLLRTANQSRLPARRITEELQRALTQVRASFREVIIGSGVPGQTELLDNPNLLFECGWSWGIVENAPEVDTPEKIGPQPKGVAPSRPYLYFTVIALDGIVDLFSERTRTLGLLNPQQQRLAQALQVRWDLTQSYWATLATLGNERWPLEDIPWRTTDGQESDYYSLLVTSMVVQNIGSRRASGTDLERVVRVLEDLATRGRMTRRELRDDDPAVRLHSPGERLTLLGADSLGPPVNWLVSDFAALLLKRAVRVATLTNSTELRERVLSLVDDVWGHLLERRLGEGVGGGLWDNPAGTFTAGQRHDRPSWYFTQRVVECLVLAAQLVQDSPLRSPSLTGLTLDLLNEADHLFSRELLTRPTTPTSSVGGSLVEVQEKLQRSRDLLGDRPGSAMALVLEVLRDIDGLAGARQDVEKAR